MNMPMPLELILAAHDFKIPCIMSLQYGCEDDAAYVVTFGHSDGTEHCEPMAQLPLCKSHTRAAQLATDGGPLMDLAGATPPPDCECGKSVTILRVRTVKGEMP